MANDTLEAHYGSLSRGGELVSRCHMALSGADLAGKRVLDIGCRRGKGAFKLSERVGAEGFVLGIDWNPVFVEAAQEAAPRALERSGLAESNLAFRVAYPEDLASAGVEDGSFDLVYLNNGFVLFADPAHVLCECARALMPGGVLILEAPVAATAPTEVVLAAARAEGASAKAARTRSELKQWLQAAGFGDMAFVESTDLGDGKALLELQAVKR